MNQLQSDMHKYAFICYYRRITIQNELKKTLQFRIKLDM